MKNNILLLRCAAIIIAFVFCGCASLPAVSDDGETTETPSAIVEPSPTPTINLVTGNEIYDLFLTNKMNELSTGYYNISLMDFRLFDIDGDERLELWYIGSSDIDDGYDFCYPVGFCTIINGQVVELLEGKYNWGEYSIVITAYCIEMEQHVIGMESEDDQGYYDCVYYLLNNGVLVEQDVFHSEWDGDDEVYNRIYFINGDRVSEVEYNNVKGIYTSPVDNKYSLPGLHID